MSLIQKMNGISIALVMGLVNSGLSLMVAFGLNMTPTETGSITAFVNAGLVLIAAASHNVAKHSQEVIPAGPVDQSGTHNPNP